MCGCSIRLEEMAQCMGTYWWQASLRRHLVPHSWGSKIHSLSGMSGPSSFISRASCWEAMMLARFHPDLSSADSSKVFVEHPSVICFRDDDSPYPDHLLDKDYSDLSVRTSLEIRFSPWAVELRHGAGRDSGKVKVSSGGPTGGGKNGDGDGGGDGGGGGGDDEGEDHIFLLPVLTLAFASFHLGYCIAIWVKDDNLDLSFFRTGLGLFGLLTIAALRLNARTGIDAYILGLGASVGVMVWTGERCLVKKEGNPAGIVALFAAFMAVMFTAALYHNI